ncbi:exopolysaccharide biosynthesis protein [Parvularcula sp. ZS-1/3]|uniref:Exopolysaccharide biosynthesis protein n=1 Tax=Parvularcula mediterranea TaxID=2732508 RepID=A0A7Y3RLG0_9PROT|nr:exopolysaccharide biosynthesis protein [Parvularcula mediterranea]NNU15522.1 exopolysaccharide biosynthesis protein [Parvularcula mediterranea]
MSETTSSVTGLLDTLDEAVRRENAAGSGKVSVGTILDSIGNRSYGPFLLVPALIELSPVGGIPGVPTVLAFIVLTAAVQMLAGREHIWVPGFIERRRVKGAAIEKADQMIRPLAKWLDRHTRERFRHLLRTPMVKLAAFLVICLCLTVPPLELIPFASAIPMAAIALFGLALLVRDGLVMAIAFMSVALAAAGIFLVV